MKPTHRKVPANLNLYSRSASATVLTHIADPVDDVNLCGAVCVWLSKQSQRLNWLSGHLVSANWDQDEVQSHKSEILDQDLLKVATMTRLADAHHVKANGDQFA